MSLPPPTDVEILTTPPRVMGLEEGPLGVDLGFVPFEKRPHRARSSPLPREAMEKRHQLWPRKPVVTRPRHIRRRHDRELPAPRTVRNKLCLEFCYSSLNRLRPGSKLGQATSPGSKTTPDVSLGIITESEVSPSSLKYFPKTLPASGLPSALSVFLSKDAGLKSSPLVADVSLMATYSFHPTCTPPCHMTATSLIQRFHVFLYPFELGA